MKSSHPKIASVAAIASLGLLSSCIAPPPSYLEYRGDEIRQGSGGAVETFNSVEIWTSGMPNKKFRIVGVYDPGLPGVFDLTIWSTKGYQNAAKKAIVKAVKDHGADGAILGLVESRETDPGKVQHVDVTGYGWQSHLFEYVDEKGANKSGDCNSE